MTWVMDTIDMTLNYYGKKLGWKPTLPKEFKDDIIKRADKMSGCFGADYINHKVYTYLIEYAFDKGLNCVDCYVDSEDICEN